MRRSIWLAPAPAKHLAYLRIATGLFALSYLIVRGPHLWSFGSYGPERYEPVGIVGLLTNEPLKHEAVALAVVVSWLLGLLFIFGVRFKLSAPLFAFMLLWVTSYRNSFGAVLHTENLMVIHVALLSVTKASDALSIDARGKSFPRSAHYRWPVPSLVLVSGLTYVLAGYAKLQASGLSWLNGDLLRNQLAYDNLRKHLLGDYSSPFIGIVTEWSWIWMPIAIATLVLEFGAPLALLGRTQARYLAAGLWGFHVGVMALMVIAFPYQLSGVAFLSFLLIGADDESQRPSNFAGRFSIKAWAASRKSAVRNRGSMPVN